MLNLIDDVPRLEQASHWEVTKHHLQAAKHNISSDSLTPSGEDGHSPMVTIGEDGEVDVPFFTGTICRLIIITHYPSKCQIRWQASQDEICPGTLCRGTKWHQRIMDDNFDVFSNLRHKPGHKGQGCGVNLHVTVTKRWWGPEWKILIWILVTFNTDIDRDTHIEFCMISMLILFRQHIM